jgi:hypothetical protein
MDNNQQTPSQVATKPDLSAQTSPDNSVAAPVKDLGVNSGTPISSGTSPFTGSNESMTTGEKAGGNIVTTETGSKA